MRNQQPLRLFLVLLISTLYIFSFSQLGTLAYDAFANKQDYFAEGTIIGNLPVAGKTEEEAKSLVNEEVSEWFTNTNITVQYMEKSKTLDLGSIEFDVEASVSEAEQGMRNLVQARIQPLNDFLMSLSPSINLEDFNVGALQNEILNSAMVLEPGDYTFRAEDFHISASLKENEVIEELSIIFDQQNDEIGTFAGKTIAIAGKSQFSFLKYLEEEKLQTLSAQSLNKVASAIYRVILPTNFSIIERHISSSLPPYAVLGFEAKVDAKKKLDLAFSNPNDSEYALQFVKKGQSLIVSLKGPEFLNEYTISLEDEKTFAPKTIKQFSPLLEKGGVKVKSEGQNGLFVKVFRESHDENGALLQKKLISEDFYAPLHRIELHALKESTSTSEAPGDKTDDEQNGTGDEGTDQNGEDGQDGTEKNGTGKEDTSGEAREGNGGEDKTAEDGSDSDLWGDPNEVPKR